MFKSCRTTTKDVTHMKWEYLKEKEERKERNQIFKTITKT
jgi:hypothetical protein